MTVEITIGAAICGSHHQEGCSACNNARDLNDRLLAEARAHTTSLSQRLEAAVSALEKISTARAAFNAHPVGVIASMQEWATEALVSLRADEGEG